MSKTLTRADLAEAVYEEIGLSRQDSTELVESLLDTISDKLAGGQSVKLSSFGAFNVRDKNGRIGRNPKTGEEVPILPRRVLVFRPSHVLKKRINDGPDTPAEPVSAPSFAPGGAIPEPDSSF